MYRKCWKVVLGLLAHVRPSIFSVESLGVKLLFTIFFSEQPFYRNDWTLNSHTNTVISYPFAYWSRWRRKPWQGLWFSPCKWGRDSNSPLFSNRENNGLQSVCSLHYVLSNILYLIILMQVTFVQFYGAFLDIYTKSIYALLCRSIVRSLLCYCLRARDHCCVLCDVTRDLLFTWYMVHQPFYLSDTLMFISVKLSFKHSSMLFSCLKKTLQLLPVSVRLLGLYV